MIIAYNQKLIIVWSMIIAYDQQLIIDHWSTNIIHDQQILYNKKGGDFDFLHISQQYKA